jgi:lipopolysaccharide/colanic/teichoic acid biosynthesis glycosyltransferase
MDRQNLIQGQVTLTGQEARKGGLSADFPGAAKRLYDAIVAAFGLIALSPVFLVVAVLIKLSDRGSIFYRQKRVGLGGKPFLMCKFRTMKPRADEIGPWVTSDGDTRVTRLGRILRKTKVDELPQLWNVLKGEMSLVGPRPEIPRYVERYTPEQCAILKLKPGITDLASLHFRNEELLLKNAQNVEEFYIHHCIPKKIKFNLQYAAQANLARDTWIILQTLCPYWVCLLTVYGLVLAASFLVSCQLVYDFAPPPRSGLDFSGTMIAFVAVQLGALIWRKQCRGMLSFFSLPELGQIAGALGAACLLLLCLQALAHISWPPAGVIFVDALCSLCALGGFRLLLRYWREYSSSEDTALDRAPLRVGIIGAGETGSQLALELMVKKQFGRSVVAFFDDDVHKWHKLLHDIPVIGMPECLLEGWAGKLDEVIIAMPEAPANRVREIGRLLQRVALRAYTAPSVHNLWSGNGNHS